MRSAPSCCRPQFLTAFSAGRVRGVYEWPRSAKMAASRPGALRPRWGAATIFEHPGHKNFVDLDEDLHLADLVNAHQEGFDSVVLLKRYSTVGMGPSQGKLANRNAARVVAQLNGGSHGVDRNHHRAPLLPAGAPGPSGGTAPPPHARTPVHDWHEQAGRRPHPCRRLVPAGVLPPSRHRPRHCIVQEAQQVRTGLGMIDVSTLGKLLVNGPDAAELLERIYTGRFKKLAVGRCRYGVALDESAA